MFIRNIGYDLEGGFFVHAFTYLPDDNCTEWEYKIVKKLDPGQEISTLDVETMLETMKQIMLRKMGSVLEAKEVID
jgi:hypothetical protein